MKQFYKVFSDKKVSTLWTQLSWSHYRELLKFNDINIINFYLNISVNQNLSVRELSNKIKNKEYERLDEQTKKEKFVKVLK